MLSSRMTVVSRLDPPGAVSATELGLDCEAAGFPDQHSRHFGGYVPAKCPNSTGPT